MSQLTLQLPDPVIESAKRLADQKKLSLEEFVSMVVAEAVRLDEEWERRVRRGKKVTRERFLEILRKAPDVEPEPWDRIE